MLFRKKEEKNLFLLGAIPKNSRDGIGFISEGFGRYRGSHRLCGRSALHTRVFVRARLCAYAYKHESLQPLSRSVPPPTLPPNISLSYFYGLGLCEQTHPLWDSIRFNANRKSGKKATALLKDPTEGRTGRRQTDSGAKRGRGGKTSGKTRREIVIKTMALLPTPTRGETVRMREHNTPALPQAQLL